MRQGCASYKIETRMAGRREEQLLEPALNLTIHCCGREFRVLNGYDQKSFDEERGLNICEHTSSPCRPRLDLLRSNFITNIDDRGLNYCVQTTLQFTLTLHKKGFLCFLMFFLSLSEQSSLFDKTRLITVIDAIAIPPRFLVSATISTREIHSSVSHAFRRDDIHDSISFTTYRTQPRAHIVQAQEQEELTIEERSKLFVKLMNKRKKHFAKLKAEEQRRKPSTKAQKRNTMSTYLKNMARYKHNQLKTKSFEDIQILFDKAMTRVNTFVDMDTELVKGIETRTEGSSKRAEEELVSENLKKHNLDENVEAEVDKEAEMKKHMEIVPDDEVAIDAIPVRFSKLINDMRNIRMTMSRMQLNSKFVNSKLMLLGIHLLLPVFVTAIRHKLTTAG
ncbi:hypothetical protein Tco_0752801 [Tanacetum coccineum]|uniref:Uncharacterized protein n=1 Tax=Tanacetum coccineum TaxID=301880 RepID=A0ABQ4ZB75_9ASTR